VQDKATATVYSSGYVKAGGVELAPKMGLYTNEPNLLTIIA
jgi:hypothetical protein